MTHALQSAPKTTESKSPSTTSKAYAPATPTVAPAWERALGTAPIASMPLPMQTKLTVNQPGDEFEQQADRVADQVMRMPAPRLQRATCACGGEAGPDGECAGCKATRLQRQVSLEAEADAFAHAAATPNVRPPALSLGAARQLSPTMNPLMRATIDAALATPGEPVAHGLAPFGTETSSVRIHRDPLATATARLLGAHAYTYGSHIVLGPSAQNLGSPAGRDTFAHELAHVGQQTAFGLQHSAPRAQFSLQSYITAMQQKPEPDWKTAAEHLNGESLQTIQSILGNLSPHYRAKLHEAARTWPGLCSNIGRLTEADYLKEHPETTNRVADTCDRKPEPVAPSPTGGGATTQQAAAASTELSESDATSCSPLYLQKLCVYIIGGFNGDRSGVETAEEMAGYNTRCREESGYTGRDIEVNTEERAALRTPRCARGDPAKAREKARAARVADALNRSTKYMPTAMADQLLAILKDPIFLGSLALAVGVYLALWLAPEPVFTKIAAAATTLAILSTGVFSVSTILNLANAWMDLENEAGSAQNDAQIEEAARRFGTRMGAIEADLLVFLASLLVGGRIPGPKRLPPAGKAIADAERSFAGAQQGGVVIEGPWGRARAVSPGTTSAGPTTAPPPAVQGNLALKVEPYHAPVPAKPGQVIPFPKQQATPATATKPAPATSPAPATTTQSVPVVVLPGVGTQPNQKPRPPFVLRLPQQKAPHLTLYRNWLGVLQSDPNYVRGNPAQLDKWHQALRIGGSHGIPSEIYERGHRLGFTGAAGEERIRVPNWSRNGKSVAMQVDHIIELQVTPDSMRNEFNSIDNYELLDQQSNGSSGPLLAANIAAERAQQVAYDPSAATRVLHFEQVVMDGGTPGDRWLVSDLQQGRQLDAFENR